MKELVSASVTLHVQQDSIPVLCVSPSWGGSGDMALDRRMVLEGVQP